MPLNSNFFRIGRVLGRGAFGKVQLAMDKLTDNLVAIKSIIKKDVNKEERDRAEQEMELLKECDHKHVVRVFNSFETVKHTCFVMELCCGGDLQSFYKRRRRLKQEVAKYVFKQLLLGLDYLHTKKLVVHRDIKPENILLDSHGKLKIGDFGVSRKLRRKTQRMSEQCGTPAYIAPEII